jgi:hypothetical protein
VNIKIITYDLRGENRDYESLINKIKAYHYWAKITESCWLIKSGDSCVDVRNNLKKVTNYNDRLFVADLSSVSAWSNVMCNSNKLKKWLLDN